LIRDFSEGLTAPRMIHLAPPPRIIQIYPTPVGDADDESAEMRAEWKEWHKRVADAIFKRFSSLANAHFGSRPLTAVAAYTVTSDGRSIVARLTQENSNSNPIFNAMVLSGGDELIDESNDKTLRFPFPAGSKRDYVGFLLLWSVDKEGRITVKPCLEGKAIWGKAIWDQ